MTNRIKIAAILFGLAMAIPHWSHADIIEGFDPVGGGFQSFDDATKQSADSGFTWAHSGSHGFVALWDNGSNVMDWGNGCCNPPAEDYVFTIFSTTGTATPDTSVKLGSIQFDWRNGGGTGLVRALIRDDSGAWFLSDDTANSFGSTSISALTTTWTEVTGATALTPLNALTTDADVPLSGNLGTAGAGTPNLNSVTGGGYYWQTAPVGSMRLDTLTFISVPESSTIFLMVMGLLSVGLLLRRRFSVN